MRVVMVAILFVSRLLLASDPLGQATRPALASSDSPWNVLAYGGKGQMHGAPICHSLTYFSLLTTAFDFDDDFFGVPEDDLLTRSTVTFVGDIAFPRVYEVKQRVTRKDAHFAVQIFGQASQEEPLGKLDLQLSIEETKS